MSIASQRVLDYLEGQRGVVFAKLYQQPSTALAVFRRMLPHLAKSIVMAMLYMPGPFSASDLDAWFKSDTASQRYGSLRNTDRTDRAESETTH